MAVHWLTRSKRVETVTTFGAAAIGEFRAKFSIQTDDPISNVVIQKQTGLRFKVRTHGAVIIDVIATQISKNGGIKVHTVHAILLERVRRNLDRSMSGALVAKPGKDFMEFNTGWCRHRSVAVDSLQRSLPSVPM